MATDPPPWGELLRQVPPLRRIALILGVVVAFLIGLAIAIVLVGGAVFAVISAIRWTLDPSWPISR